MILQFPSQPQDIGTPYEAPNGYRYIWDGVKWNATGSPSGSNLGNIFIVDQTIAGINATHPVVITGNVTMGNLTAGNVAASTLKINGHVLSIVDGNVQIDNISPGTSHPYDQDLNTTDWPLFQDITIIDNVILNGTTINTDNGKLYVNGTEVGVATELVAGDYIVKLYPNGNTIIPGTISSTATGIPEFNSSTDLNLTAANRVNIVNSPLNLASFENSEGLHTDIIGKPGDLIYDSTLKQIQTYINGTWENLLRTAENQNVRLPFGGAYQRADGVRAAWFTEIPADVSQLTDNNNLLTSQSITLQNIDIDGGGAYSIYETGLMFADGGFGSSRFGPSDTVFDGAGANSTYTTTLNGGGA